MKQYQNHLQSVCKHWRELSIAILAISLLCAITYTATLKSKHKLEIEGLKTASLYQESEHLREIQLREKVCEDALEFTIRATRKGVVDND